MYCPMLLSFLLIDICLATFIHIYCLLIKISLRQETYEPNSFSHCTIMIGPPLIYYKRVVPETDNQYIFSYISETPYYPSLFSIPGIFCSHQGHPPNSHSAQTLGPGRRMTIITSSPTILIYSARFSSSEKLVQPRGDSQKHTLPRY